MSKEKLLNVARALRESTEPERYFTMERWGHRAKSWNTCGTPACALGHYAVRADLQDTFTLNLQGKLEHMGNMTGLGGNSPIQDHFDITFDESQELFSPRGCGHAQTREQAAAYIENFAEQKWPTPPLVIDGPTTLVQAEQPVPVKAKVEERELVCV